VAEALHANDKLLTLAIPAKERDVTVGWAGAYDYAALGAQSDLVTIMAYEYRGPFSGPGSVAPFDWVQRVARFASSQIPPEKVLLGLAFYGYDWNTTSGGTRSIGYPQFAALAERYAAPVSFDPAQRSLTFEYEGTAGEPTPGVAPPARPNHVITVRNAPRCDVQPPPAPPPPPRPPAPQAGTPQAHAVWLEDAASAAARLDLAAMYRTGGVAAWRLGLEDPNVWDVFRSWFDRP
jgi:spore germination protein YaaH